MKFHDLKKGMRLVVTNELSNWGYKKGTVITINSHKFNPPKVTRYSRKYGDKIAIIIQAKDILGRTYEKSGYYLTEKAYYDCEMMLECVYQSPLWKVLNGEEI